MKKFARYLVGFLAFNVILGTIPHFGQQQKRRRRESAVVQPEVKPPAARGGLSLKKVVLYSNGVGYFERRGDVTGNSTLSLQFTPEEIDDVLKSLVIFDRNNGRISSVSFDTAKPLDVALSEFAFDLSGDANQSAGMAKLLSSFTGASIEVKEGPNAFVGKIVGIEKHDQATGDHKTESYWLAIVNDNGEPFRCSA